MAEEVVIHGSCDERFEPLKDAFATNFNEGLELGACLAVTHHGKLVVDLWAGYADPKKTRPWERDTLVLVFSTNKVPLSMCAWVLMDQGLLDIDVPVKIYWPEMSGGAKDKMTTRHILLHSAGLPGFADPIPFEAMFDWKAMVHRLETEPLWFEPGSMQVYHLVTYGWLVGEVVRRISGLKPGEFMAERICGPLGIDWFSDLPVSEHYRVANNGASAPRMPDPEQFAMMIKILDSIGPNTRGLTQALLSADIPAAYGVADARGMARLGAIVAMGGQLDGVRILSRETVEYATREHSREFDHAEQSFVGRGLGVGRETSFFQMMTPEAVGWGGYGGSILQMDPSRELSLAYAPNLLSPEVDTNPRTDRVVKAMRAMTDSLDD